MRKLFLLLLLIPYMGCASDPFLPPVSSSVHSGNFKIEADEKRLWDHSEQALKEFEKRNLFFTDPQLELYLNEIARKLQPPEIFKQIPFKVKVVKDSRLNASAFPNGVILIHTGILSHMENEAEFAMLLSHEMTHTTHRHLINQYRKLRGRDFIFVSQIAYSGYSQEFETEADTVGFKAMVDAGYDPIKGKQLYRHLKAYLEEEKIGEPFFFGTHPRVQERIENLEILSGQFPGKKDQTDSVLFLSRIHDAIFENAVMNLEAGRLKQAEREAEKCLKITPRNARAYTLLGRIYQKKEKADGLKKALTCFEKAIESDSSYPDAYREKGLIHFKKGDKSLAKDALQRYLTLARDARDRKLIEDYVRQCSEGGKR